MSIDSEMPVKTLTVVYLRPTYYRWFQINEDGARNVLSCSGFAEKGVE